MLSEDEDKLGLDAGGMTSEMVWTPDVKDACSIAGFLAEATASPTCLLSAGRSCGLDMAPEAPTSALR